MTARSSRPVRSRAAAAASSSASSSAETETAWRRIGARRRQWRLASPLSTISSGPNTSSTASRRRSAVRRLTASSR